MVCNILIILITIFTAIMGFNYVNVTSLSYIHLQKKNFDLCGVIEYMHLLKIKKGIFWQKFVQIEGCHL